MLESDRFLALVHVRPLSAHSSRDDFCQKSRVEGFPRGFLSETMRAGRAIAGTHHAPMHVCAHSRSELAARAAAAVPPSPSSRLLLVAGVPGDLPGASPGQRAGEAGPAP